ncbi:MAG: MATE family efflux transporter [Lautropia sp.]
MASGPIPAQPLLTAPILPALLRFALPNMAAMLATALATIAETAYVGRFGVPSLAGLALVFPMVILQMMLSGGSMGGGVAAAISRALGAGAPARANALAVHAMWIGLAAGVLNGLLMLVFGPAIFAGLGGRDEALSEAIAYSNVAFCGSVGVWLMNTFASVLRGAGNMRVPSATFLLVSLAQVVIAGALGLGWGPLPRLGMPGVAAGQAIAFSAGALFLFGYLRSGRSAIGLSIRDTSLQRPLLGDILKVGALACVSPVQTVATVLITTRLVAQFGPTALAGYGIGARLELLLIPICFAIGVASVPLVGMAIGAGLAARAKRVAWIAALLTAATLSVLGALVAFAPGLWVTLYTHDPAAQASAGLYFRWAGPAYGLFGLGLCLYFAALGSGRIGGLVLAGTLRLVVVAIGGWALLQASAEPWTVFALVAFGMALFGLAAAFAVRVTRWGDERPVAQVLHPPEPYGPQAGAMPRNGMPKK